jgi:TPR repeat protein
MQAPAQLGKYEIRREIGRGAMGVVYEAFDPSIGRAVAIKVFRPGTSVAASADEMDARFRREAQVAGRLSHPNLVVVHEFGEATVEGTVVPYIVMELVRGTDLKALLASRGRLTLAEIARVMNDLLAALQHAHERGVVHRDIKPGNLMLCDDDGRLKVADFGIAKTADSELTRTGELLGTAAYMSPEQVTGAPVDLRTDIYAAGVILYQLLTGEPPFSGGSTTSVIQKILNQEPVAPSVLNVTIPRALDAVVQQAMAKKPAARFASAAAFARAITAAIDASGNDGTTIVSPPPVAAAKPRRARTAAMIAAGAAVVVLLGYAAFAWLGPHGGTGRGDADVASREVPAASMPATRAASAGSDRAVALATPAASVAAAPAPPAVASAGPAMAASATPVAVAAPRAVASAARPKAAPPATVRPATAASAGSPNLPRATANAAAAPTYAPPPMPVDVKPLPAPATPQPASVPTRVAAVTASAPARPASSTTATTSAAKVATPSSGIATANPVLASCEAKARAGDAVCQTQLATMYRNGDGVARNFAEALRWYRLAADQGLADAQNRLGAMLAAGQGTAPDHNEAARWYRKAADQGHAAAQNNLGRCYERGEGVTGSPVLASQWYRKSADQGHAAAEYNLGRLYQTGSGVFKDIDKARALFQSAAGHGNASAAYALGVMYENGTGVPQSNAQAAYWYRIAAAKPDPGLSTASQQRIKSFLAAHP